MCKAEKAIRAISVIICEVFTLYTIVMLCMTRQFNRLPLALATILLILLPEGIEWLLPCRLHTGLYVFSILYAIGPMFGQCHNFYYTVSWWDKLLHLCGGVLFAIAGWYLCRLMNHGQSPLLLCAAFALCFSIALSALWEFVEFGSDQLLQTDMQNDSVVTSLHSYLLGDSLGATGSIEDISTVVVDGTPLPVTGYLDIGLLDTMTDMLLESLGAAVTCAVYLLDRGKHPLIRDQKGPPEVHPA